MEKYIKRVSMILVIAIIFSIGVACSKEDDSSKLEENTNEKEEIVDETSDLYPLNVEDGFGEEWTFEEEPNRIISLAPSHTEILFALGLDEKIVGVTSFADYPEAALEKDKIGDVQGINLERIIELEPDLVLNYGFTDNEELSRLKEAGIKVLGFEPETIDEVIQTIKKIGQITNTEKQADEIITDMENKRDEIVKKVEGLEKKRVFYEIWHEPLMAAGPGSFMDELITLSGGINIASDAEGAYSNYDLEALIEKDPEVYLTSNDLPEKTKETIEDRPGYEGITAIKQGDIYLLDGNITSRPGPRIVEALEIVAKSIHPEIFK
jgi:cobalamin transport system substrate-binding protein